MFNVSDDYALIGSFATQSGSERFCTSVVLSDDTPEDFINCFSAVVLFEEDEENEWIDCTAFARKYRGVEYDACADMVEDHPEFFDIAWKEDCAPSTLSLDDLEEIHYFV